MPSSFTDLVFAGERIEVGLMTGKFDYVSSTSTNARRIGATGAKRKEGDTHAVTSAPTWVKPLQTSHGTHQYAQHHPRFSARVGDSSNSAPREAPQAPAPSTTCPAGNAHFGAGSNAMRNFPPRPTPEFTAIPMTYKDLLASLIANQMAVISPEKIYQPPFPKWYNPDATCAYHGKTLGHFIEKCLALKYKVQHLTDVGWLTFEEDRPNVKQTRSPIMEGEQLMPSSRDVTTPRRFIYEALQKRGVIPHSGHGEDSCLMHPSELHNMETSLAMEDLFATDDRSRPTGKKFGRPKPLVVYFTKDVAPQTPRYPSPCNFVEVCTSKRKEEATDISSLSTKVTNITGLSGVTHSGRMFAPPDLPTQPANVKGKAKMVEEQNDKTTLTPNEDIPVTNLPEKRDGCGKKEVSLEEAGEFLRIIQQSEFKVIEQLNKTPARVSLLELLMSSEPHRALLVKVLNEAHEDILVSCPSSMPYVEAAEESLETAFQSFEVVSIASVDSFSGQPCLSDTAVMVARVMLGNGYEPGMGLGKNNSGRTSLISTRVNRGKFGLGYKPTQVDIRKSVAGRKSGSQGSQLGRKVEGGPSCYISRSFISAGLGHEGQVIVICEDDSPSGSDLVRPCPPGFRLGNWRVEERPDIYATSIISDDESLEGTNTWDPTIDFKQETDQTEDEEDKDEMAPKKLSMNRSRRDAAAEGSNAAPEFDSHRFRSTEHQHRFEAIKGWSFHRERHVQLKEDEYTYF
ncbi:hypothetical protein GmHk_14G041237 [Glycine max]|nr:hypothetical protein GmHk_14G041237 [Glycine max]